MKPFLSFLLTIITLTFADDITVSKDSLKVYNNDVSSVADMIVIKNNSDRTIDLDSAYIVLSEYDTTATQPYLLQGGTMEIHWADPIKKSDFGWYCNEAAHNIFKLSKKYFSPNDTAVPLHTTSGDSCAIVKFRIGFNLVSSRIPMYPNYVYGTLQLFFNNNQVVTIVLYSDDLRVNTVIKCGRNGTDANACCHTYFLINGKKIVNAELTPNNFILKVDQYGRLKLNTVNLVTHSNRMVHRDR